MSLHDWTDYNARMKSPQPTDTVELPEVLVLEGEAAEVEIARYYANHAPQHFRVGSELTHTVSPLSVQTPTRGVAELYPQSLRGERPYSQVVT